MREICTSGSTRGRRVADFSPLLVVLLYRLDCFMSPNRHPHDPAPSAKI